MPDSDFARTLEVCSGWPVPHVSAAVSTGDRTLAWFGDSRRIFRLASISKVFTAWACMIAAEEGSVSLDDPIGPPGATLRHCLAHAAGFSFDGLQPIAGVGRMRIYSNTGINVAADHVAARTGIAFGDYLREAIFEPLALHDTTLHNSPAHGIHSSTHDVTTFARELLRPTLISRTSADDVLAVQFPELPGMVPGIGSFDPNPWGLGIEIRGNKSPHWMGTRTSPRTCGHFGGAGTMFWIDPERDLALVALTDQPFDEWSNIAPDLWATLSDAVVDTFETSDS